RARSSRGRGRPAPHGGRAPWRDLTSPWPSDASLASLPDRRLRRHRPDPTELLALRAREPTLPRDLPERHRALRRGPRVRVEVHPVEPEARLVALGPLEVVHERPVVVAAHVDA